MGKFNESHDVWLLDVIKYKNYRLLKMYMRFPYWKSIARGVIFQSDAMKKMYRLDNQYMQVQIRTHSHDKSFYIPLTKEW